MSDISVKVNRKKVMSCEVYSRVVGYYRPIRNWNVGKRQEFAERNTYDQSLRD